MQSLLVILVLLGTVGFTATVAANEPEAPDVQLKIVTAEVLALIGRDKAVRPLDATKLERVIQGKVVPLFNFERMTQDAMAANWRLATAEQQKALTEEFRTLLVRTYSGALNIYRGESIEYQALRVAPAAVEATVKSVVRKTGAATVTIDYDMEKTAAGWKVHEIKLDGIKLIAVYRDSFAAKVRESGVDGLIKALQAKNRQNTPV